MNKKRLMKRRQKQEKKAKYKAELKQARESIFGETRPADASQKAREQYRLEKDGIRKRYGYPIEPNER